ncbi:MAG TPA: TonB-dependent receptor [Bryobacteraceae bacterium]|nr:TonB-dependent receptor [Bryobacteraceae bacterium]
MTICLASYGQSTFGTVLGTVKDPSGSAVPRATVDLTNVGTNATRTTTTNDAGNYQFVNVEIGTYQLKVAAAGFQTVEFTNFDIAARDTKRFDADMKLATQATVVTVESTSILQTETSSVAETKGSLELTDLPVSIGSRSTGSTSAFSTLTAQPGVQIDNNNNITVAGATTSQLSFSIDGISSVGPGFSAGPLTEMFPSFNAIEEIRISENLNPAEYGGVADVTTVSKSGTNTFHGGGFENLQNNDFNAADTFSHTTPLIRLNDFGAYLGGPVILPKYNGRDKTFFFGSFERLSLPKAQTSILSTPTEAMRNGDLSEYLLPQNGGADNALTGYPGNIIPSSQINPWSKALLNYFYPLPNYGPPGAVSNNYLATFLIPIKSAQFDARIDENISAKHAVFFRYTYKNRRVTNYPNFPGTPGTPLVGNTSNPEIDQALTGGYNWIVSPSLVNEFRGGFTKWRQADTFGLTTEQVANALGITGPPNGFPQALPTATPTYPEVTLSGFMQIPGSPNNDINTKQGTIQISDTLTYTKQKHTFKFGGDFRHLTAYFTNVFLNARLGNYAFLGATQDANGDPWLGSGGAAGIAELLLGYPDSTNVSTVLNPTTNSWANHYAFFIQDDFKVSPTFTLNYGLRYEYHPVFEDYNNNIANFVPSYTSVQDGQLVHGAVIVPNQQSLSLVNPGFTQSIAPTPILLASQLGIPQGLRYSQKTDFAPRVGFAWRLGDKMVLRGGYGRFIEAPLSLSAIDGWSVEASDFASFPNSLGDNGLPQFKAPYSFPSNIATPGSQWFDLATDIHYKDPYVQEWDLTLERDLGKGFGVRVGYDGSHGSNLPTDINLNQLPTNTVGSDALAASVPFPQMFAISYQTSLGFSNYNAGTVSVKKRAGGLQMEASYTYTRNLANTAGAPNNQAAQPNVTEFGNTLLSDPYHPGLDYGNVSYTRRHRFLTTFLYNLPFGKGRTFMNSSNRVVDAVFGGWELSGIWLWQSGPFLSVSTYSDPSGTGYVLCPCNYNGGRADTVPGVNPYAGRSINQWINPNAFTDPGNNIGRFGDASQGDIVGPGTFVLSTSLIKNFTITERVHLQIGAQAANVTNHPNYQPPANLNVDVPAFGQITAMQVAEAGGPRQIQLTGRIVF